MAMVFQFKAVFLRNAALGLLDLRIFELHDFFTLATDQMIMVRLGTPALIIGIATRPETLRDHARLKKDRKIPVNRIARDLKPLFFKTGDKDIHVEMPALAFDPFNQF